MKLIQGNFYWNKQNKIKYNYPYMKEDKKCDVLVIGGGIGGAITAYFQAKQGYKVVIVEKNIIGYGSTMENPGILSLEEKMYVKNKNIKSIDDKQIQRCNILSKQAINSISEIVKEINEFNKEEKIVIPYKTQDCIFYSERVTNKLPIYKEYEKKLAMGENIEYIENNPIINLRTGIVERDSAVIFDPYLFTQELIHMLSTYKNVEVYENTCIDTIALAKNNVENITSNRFRIISKKVIISTGYEAIKYVKDIQLSIIKTFSIVTEPITSLNKDSMDFIAKDIVIPYNYIRFTDKKEIMMGGNVLKVTEKVINDRYIEQIIDGRYKKLFNNLQKMLPNEEKIKIKNCYYGMFLETKDNLPIIDELENLPNVYVNIGIGANGIVYSTIGANMLKDICKEYHTKDMIMFKIRR